MSGPDADYYAHARKQIEPLLPSAATSILDIGCGAGETLKWLSTRYPNAWMGGIEIDQRAAGMAAGVCDWLSTEPADVALTSLPRQELDLVLCLDVLEHMTDPWAFMLQLKQRLAPASAVIVSLPNIRHYRALKRIVFEGDFRYEPAGIFDRTHLRFFTRISAIRMFRETGFCVDRVLPIDTTKRKIRLIKKVTHRLNDFFAYQYLFRLSIEAPGDAQLRRTCTGVGG